MLQKSPLKTCPCCGQPLPTSTDLVVNLDYNTASRNGLMFGMEPQSAVLLKELANKWPTAVTHERMESATYGWTEPTTDEPKKVVRVRISRLRHQLRPLGLGIVSVYGIGYRLELL